MNITYLKNLKQIYLDSQMFILGSPILFRFVEFIKRDSQIFEFFSPASKEVVN